ncbi:single hybrid motif-containing protein [Auriscalpium vulgare]|uniref:Single hybrid motif-containing protein n=1 Tax=Auriscalpium vulgare TaxID=40419 RepID=A0ACB8RDN4_9AGAM|nr:single hybrid motif-containing protein [Auriscalpium vulgare]
MVPSVISRAAVSAVRAAASRRGLHSTAARRAVTKFEMPAMSPTMTEGGITSWKVKDGDSFSAGDVLLEIETDKATIDVEAQEEGIMGKIITPDGAKNIPVGRVIALLAEEGDDISNLEVPKEESQPASAPKVDAPAPPPPPPSQPQKPKSHKPVEHSRPLFPSVARLLAEHDVADPEKIKGTGVRGMLTKGDVLAFLGKASSPTGTYKEEAKKTTDAPPKKAEAKAEPVSPLDGLAIRRLIVGNMYSASQKAKAASAPKLAASFDSIIGDYIPSKAPKPSSPPATPPTPKASSNFLDGLI